MRFTEIALALCWCYEQGFRPMTTNPIHHLAAELLGSTLGLVGAAVRPGERFLVVLRERGRADPPVLQAALGALDNTGYSHDEFLTAHFGDVAAAVQAARAALTRE